MKKYFGLILMLVLFFSIRAVAQSDEAALNAVETPPDWLVDLLEKVYEFPVVGPIIVKVGQWFGVIVTILTSLTAFLIGAVKALQKVLSLAGLLKAADWLAAFEKGKVMYWLKYGSALFNAKKSDTKKVDETKQASA